jgi:hypothetical protein
MFLKELSRLYMIKIGVANGFGVPTGGYTKELVLDDAPLLVASALVAAHHLKSTPS